MISHIHIRNFALIREADIRPGPGLNIISGETGTGKSMVIQAVSIALGARANSSLIASGQDRGMVQLVFDLDREERQLLGRFAADPDDSQLILTRELFASGRSLARINGEIVRLSELSEIASRLVDIHGQYDNQYFLNSKQHLAILDRYAAGEITPVKQKLTLAFEQYSKTRKDLITLRQNRGEYLRRIDQIRYELNEINECNIRPGEDETLQQRAEVLANSEKISSSLRQCYDILYDNEIDRCAGLLQGLSQFGSDFSELSSAVSECAFAVTDIREQVRSLLDTVEYEPEELNQVMSRLDRLDHLKLKYGGSLEQILAHRDECERQLQLTDDSGEAENKLLAAYREQKETVLRLSGELSSLRQDAARGFQEEMNQQLRELNFQNASISVSITPHTSADGVLILSGQGTDQVEFFFRPVRNAEPRPLAEIASGGEISRISLAFRSVTGNSKGTGTMIFDEIDTGISGRTASIVASRMRALSGSHQILCITHLPQIAAAADDHFLISKTEAPNETVTTITPLNASQRSQEIARMLGGTTITETTLRSAEELIDASCTPKPAPSQHK